MIKIQLARRGVRDARVLEAMGAVPREAFVTPGTEEFAYEDSPLPIGEGQTISQPYIVAAMADAAALQPQDRVLEVGAGSGYAAAIFSRLADQVFAIERHTSLTEAARERCRALGYDNVVLKTGDGSVGWPEEAPFDAILVAAGVPTMPQALQQQLKVGGRLIVPVGGADEQRLIRVTRTGAETFEEDDLGGVRFVPLIGMQGWPDQSAGPSPSQGGWKTSLTEKIAEAAEELPGFDDPNFGKLFDSLGGKRVVLLGEASHGTSEFYRARAAITKRLVREHGFTIVAVEADWPDAAAVDRHVRGGPKRDGEQMPFQRFPTWMWRNIEFMEFVDWLRRHNQTQPRALCGFYGLDIYNMRGSMAAVLSYLDQVDPEAARLARQRYGCLAPWQRDPATYGRAVLTEGYRKCEDAVIQQCRALLEKEFLYAQQGGDEFLDAAQNARLVAAAERYYRIMYYGGAESWNLRDTHMFQTLEHLLEWHGPEAKAVVWAHNSHIGDARQTEMGHMRGELNIGQLVREKYGQDAVLIGMGTDHGTVAAASDWDGEMEIMQVKPSRDDSVEQLCHRSARPRFRLDFARHAELADALSTPRLERFIGVIYRPDTELQSHYAEASLGRQFDQFLWFDETRAVTEIGPEHVGTGVPDTYPFGV